MVWPRACQTWKCSLLCSFTASTFGWPCWHYAIYRQLPQCWSGCIRMCKFWQLPPMCQDWFHSTSGRPLKCLGNISFSYCGGLWQLSACCRSASLAVTHQTCDTHYVPTSAWISWELHIYSLCLLSEGLLYLESYPVIWCEATSRGISCRRSSTSSSCSDCRLSISHRYTAKKIGWLYGTPWVGAASWYLSIPTHWHVACWRPCLLAQFCRWPLYW